MRRKIKNTIKKFLFIIFKLNNKLYNLFHFKKYDKYVALVSCDKWKNRVKEDWYLKHYLNKANAKVDIISWQDNTIDYSKYDSLVIRSIWGFQKHKKEFDAWLDKLKKDNIKIFNNIDIIKNNYDKEIQFKILNGSSIKTIETEFVDIDDDLETKVQNLKNNKFAKYDLIITKPSISESSNDTYLIGQSNEEYKNIINFNQILTKYNPENISSKLMIQPFLKEVFDGEYSICVIDGKITHAIIKYTNAFKNTNFIKYISLKELDPKAIEIVNKVMSIKEYKDYLYMRVDLVKVDNQFQVMEVELLDPNLFMMFISDKNYKKEVLELFATEIVEKS